MIPAGPPPTTQQVVRRCEPIFGRCRVAGVGDSGELDQGTDLHEHLATAAANAQRAFGGGLRRHPSGLRGDRRVAGLDHRVQGAALMGGIALHGFDQVGNEVMALLHLHVDVGKGLVDPLPHRDQAVVDRDRPQDDDDDGEYDEITAPFSDSVIVALSQSALTLDQVVVTGQATVISKRNATTSTSNVDAAELNRAPAAAVVVLWLWFKTSPGGRRRAKPLAFLAGCLVPFAPVFWLFALGPHQTFFNIFQYQAIFRRADWKPDLAFTHDFDAVVPPSSHPLDPLCNRLIPVHKGVIGVSHSLPPPLSREIFPLRHSVVRHYMTAPAFSMTGLML